MMSRRVRKKRCASVGMPLAFRVVTVRDTLKSLALSPYAASLKVEGVGMGRWDA